MIKGAPIESVKRMQQKGQIFVLTAPSGTGKTTIITMIRKNMIGIGYSVSHTTREPRNGEVNGLHYYFIHKADFEKMIEAQEFIEWALVYDHLYGTSFFSVNSALSSGQDLLLDLDINGAQAIKKRYPESILIFILPPSMEALEERLTRRSSSHGEDIDLRMKRAAEEIKRCQEYDFIVFNDYLGHAVKEIEAIITAQRARTKRRFHLAKKLFTL
jgi:guanylate kinase